jgi:hypothetical protein
MENMTCPKCGGINWVIYAVQFETGGTLLELFAECADPDEKCKTRLRLGVVEGNDIQPVPVGPPI